MVRETIGTGTTAEVLDFIYDESGSPFALKYSTDGGSTFTTYYYVLNLQGDVIKLIEADGTVAAQYTYNAWGEILSSSGTMSEINPLRYRGYYYDTETGFYYLQSRYYDPAMHRFINADRYTSTGAGILGYNMFAYCNNSPVIFRDDSGEAIFPTSFAVKSDCVGGDEFEPINGQKLCKYMDLNFRWLTLSDNGCAIIAIYNALGLTGRKVSIPEIVDYFDSPLFNLRVFGVMPNEIGDFLSDYDISYKEANSLADLESLLSGGGTAIVTRWNEVATLEYPIGLGLSIICKVPNVFAGAHTMTIVHDGNGKYTVYNRYGNRDRIYEYNSLEEFMGSEVQFISGYYLE